VKNLIPKIVVALILATLIAALGMISWRDNPKAGTNIPNLLEEDENQGTRDEVIYEMERFYSVWRDYDTRTSGSKSTQGNS
jgi:hypothetical protein